MIAPFFRRVNVTPTPWDMRFGSVVVTGIYAAVALRPHLVVDSISMGRMGATVTLTVALKDAWVDDDAVLMKTSVQNHYDVVRILGKDGDIL